MGKRSGRHSATWVAGLLLLAGAFSLQPAPASPPADRPATLGVRVPAELWLDSSFEQVESDYDAAEDYGSLYNVADRIALDDKHPTGAGIDIAMIDTGVVPVQELSHGNVILGPDFSFEDAQPSLRSLDTNGHGTHLAGIIVGRSTGDDEVERDDEWNDEFLGLAPEARLISVKIGAADGSVDVSQAVAAINWVIENRRANGWNIRVLNLAYGTNASQSYEVDPLAHAVERAWHAGIVVVVAGGNDSRGSQLRNPAINPYIIAVGSGDREGKKAVVSEFSSTGDKDRGLDLLAPGESIVSLRNAGSFSDAYNEAGRVDQRLVRGTGSSQASAVVTAAVAVLLEDRPWLTPDQVKALLLASAKGKGTGFLNVKGALKEEAPGDAQGWTRSSGTGSIDLARGTFLKTDPLGNVIGESDIFGVNWGDTAWTRDVWSDNRWLGRAWDRDVWQGTAWYSVLWAQGKWSGNEWTGNEWSGNEWSGNEWSGNEWSAWGWSEK